MAKVKRDVSKACACGGAVKAQLGGDEAAAQKCVDQIEAIWAKEHVSPECKPATHEEAARARRKKETKDDDEATRGG